MSENHEFKQIDLSQLQKVEVRDSEDKPWRTAYYLYDRNVPNYPYEVIFESMFVSSVKYCRPYKEPTKRPMTDREIFNALKKEDCWLRDAEKSMEFNTYDTLTHKSFYEITYDGGETWHKLEVEE